MTYSLNAIFFRLPREEDEDRVRAHVASCGMRVLRMVEVAADDPVRAEVEKCLVRYGPEGKWTHVAFCLDQRPKPSGELGLKLDTVRVAVVAGVQGGGHLR